MQTSKFILLIFLLGSIASCSSKKNEQRDESSSSQEVKIVDQQSIPKVKNLYANLLAMQGKGLMFGHQDDLAYGIGWRAVDGRSDVKEVSGSYPAVYGWDISGVGGIYNIDSVKFGDMKRYIREGHERGGLVTVSWHMENPVTNTHSWDTTKAVKHIIPGGKLHETYKAELDTVAAFFMELKNIPIVFRPFHEHTGSWFWWGRGNATAEEYIALWRFTVHYLRDDKGIHNLLYAYSPDKFYSKEEYMGFFPGDEWVDILGVDDYQGLYSSETAHETITRLHTLYDISQEYGKPSAIMETGAEKIPDPRWWTDVLLKTIMTDNKTKNITWVLVWRNGRLDHHYAPYPGHPSADDFIEFKNHPFVLFEDELPDLYGSPATKDGELN